MANLADSGGAVRPNRLGRRQNPFQMGGNARSRVNRFGASRFGHVRSWRCGTEPDAGPANRRPRARLSPVAGMARQPGGCPGGSNTGL
jgi:hypothetical protein